MEFNNIDIDKLDIEKINNLLDQFTDEDYKDFKIYIKRLSTLRPYRNTAEDDLKKIAFKNFVLKKKKGKIEENKKLSAEKQTNINISSEFDDRTEKNLARELLARYLDDYQIETVSDKNLLKELIRLEVIQTRLHKSLNRFYETDTKAVPSGSLEIIHKNSDAILKLKNSLGLMQNKGKKPYDALEHLMKRHKKWREENQASRTLKCPHCQQFVLLKIRTEAWEAQKHPFFKDNVLYNKALFEHFYMKQVTVDNDFIAKVLETSPDYIPWVIKRRKGSNVEEKN